MEQKNSKAEYTLNPASWSEVEEPAFSHVVRPNRCDVFWPVLESFEAIAFHSQQVHSHIVRGVITYAEIGH